MAEDSPTNLQPLLEELAVQFGELWVRGGHFSQWIRDQDSEVRIRVQMIRVQSGSGSDTEVKVKVPDG